MIEAYGEYVLVEPINERERLQKTTTIWLKQDGPQGVPKSGKVLSIGSKVEDPEYKVGDIIYFDEPQPQGFTRDSQKYLPIHKDKILAVEL